MTKKNANVALIFVFLHKMVQVSFSIHCHASAKVVLKSVQQHQFVGPLQFGVCHRIQPLNTIG